MNKKYYIWIQYSLYLVLSIIVMMFVNLFDALIKPLKMSPAAVFTAMILIVIGLAWGAIGFYKFIMLKIFGEEARI